MSRRFLSVAFVSIVCLYWVTASGFAHRSPRSRSLRAAAVDIRSSGRPARRQAPSPTGRRPGGSASAAGTAGRSRRPRPFLSGWPGFNPPIPDYLYVMTNWYQPSTIRFLRDGQHQSDLGHVQHRLLDPHREGAARDAPRVHRRVPPPGHPRDGLRVGGQHVLGGHVRARARVEELGQHRQRRQARPLWRRRLHQDGTRDALHGRSDQSRSGATT